MTAAVITLAVALAGALGTIGYLAYALRDALVDSRASLAAEALANRQQLEERLQKQTAERQRDEALAKAKEHEATAAAALQRLADTEKQRDAAFKRGIEHAADTIKLAPSGGAALDALNELLQNVPDVP